MHPNSRQEPGEEALMVEMAERGDARGPALNIVQF